MESDNSAITSGICNVLILILIIIVPDDVTHVESDNSTITSGI